MKEHFQLTNDGAGSHGQRQYGHGCECMFAP